MFAPAQYQPQAGQPGTFPLDMMYNSNGLLLLVNTKLDSIMNKLMSQPPPSTATTTPTGQMTSAETSALLESITRIVRDNEQRRERAQGARPRAEREDNEPVVTRAVAVEKNHAALSCNASYLQSLHDTLANCSTSVCLTFYAFGSILS